MLVCGLASALLLTSPAAADITLAQGVEAVREGLASFYGGKFHGRRTASGERFDKQQFTAASHHFPLGTWLAVRHADKAQCAIVKVNDRMSRRQRGRLLDLSKGVAAHLGMLRAGLAPVEAVVLGTQRGPLGCHEVFAGVERERLALQLSPAMSLPDDIDLSGENAPAAGLRAAGTAAGATSGVTDTATIVEETAP